MSSWAKFIILLFITMMVIVVIVGTHGDKVNDECRAKGGYLVNTYGGTVCTKLEVIK